MPMVSLHKVGEGNLYHMHVLDPVDPGFGGGRPAGPDPGWGQGRPGGRPDQGLPGYGHPDHGLPGQGGIPGNELPPNPPPTLAPGWTLVLIRTGTGKWEYAAIAPGSPPPRPLPPGPPDVGPGQPNRPDQGLPGGPPPTGPGSGGIPHPGGGPVPPYPTTGPVPGQPPVAGQPLPPTATPR